MKTVRIIFIVIVLSIPFSDAISDVIEEVPDYAQFARNPHYQILVVRIKEMQDRITVNARPPSGMLQVEDVIRGRVVKQGSYQFRISPPMSGLDIEKETYKPKKEWLERQYIGPQKDDKVIISVYTARDAVKKSNELVIQGPIYRYTEENRNRIIAQMAPPERTVVIQLPLFFMILLLPVASIIFSARSRKKDITEARRRTFRTVSFLLPLLSIILYIYYESGISVYTDIRIDLLLIWPAMIANGVMLIVYSFELLIGTIRKKKK